jgi:hypothetical protein
LVSKNKNIPMFWRENAISQSLVGRANEDGGCTLIFLALLKVISSRELSNPIGASYIRVHMQKLGHAGERCNLWREKIPLGMHGPCIAYMWPMHKTYGKPTQRKDWSRRNDVMGTVSRKLGVSNRRTNKVTYVDPDGLGERGDKTKQTTRLD